MHRKLRSPLSPWPPCLLEYLKDNSPIRILRICALDPLDSFWVNRGHAKIVFRKRQEPPKRRYLQHRTLEVLKTPKLLRRMDGVEQLNHHVSQKLVWAGNHEYGEILDLLPAPSVLAEHVLLLDSLDRSSSRWVFFCAKETTIQRVLKNYKYVGSLVPKVIQIMNQTLIYRMWISFRVMISWVYSSCF